MSATKDYTNWFGKEIKAVPFPYSSEGVSYELEPLSELERKEMVEFIESSTYVSPLDRKFLKIMEEEVQYYFNGINIGIVVNAVFYAQSRTEE